MLFRFLILSDEADDFKREIKIDSESTFLDLQNAILDSVGYTKDQMTSFFICDDDWSKKTEITLVEMDTSSEEDSYVMADTQLEELLEDEHQKLLFVFDYMTERAFFMELREIVPGKDLDAPICSKSVGTPPAQIVSFDEFEAKNGSTDVGEDFYGDSEYDMDELDKSGFDGLGEGPMDYYSASNFEEDVVSLLSELHKTIPTVVMTGGSMMYIDAVCKGIDDIPTVTPEIRDALYMQFETEGLAPILAELKEADPVHYEEVDRNNYKRVIHAVEICRMTGKPYSSFRTNIKKERPFRIIKVGLNRDRDELCDRINQRVDLMMSEGLLEEARRAYPFRHLNSLNTVGYKELFNYFSGEWTLDLAVEKIKRNSRVYARKQMTWFKRDPEITWFHPDETEAIFTHLSQQII